MKSFDECLGELALEIVRSFRRNPEWLVEFEEWKAAQNGGELNVRVEH